MKLTIDDARAAGHCVTGIRDWFKAHDLDFRDFLTNGIDSEKIEALNDGFAAQVIAAKEASDGGRR